MQPGTGRPDPEQTDFPVTCNENQSKNLIFCFLMIYLYLHNNEIEKGAWKCRRMNG